MATKRKRPMLFHLRDDDRARLEMISESHGVSMGAAIRAAIRALAEQMGIPRPRPEEKNKEI